MTHDALHKLAEEIYPDERIPIEDNNSLFCLPDRIISHEKERYAFIYGFNRGYRQCQIESENKSRKKPDLFDY